MQLSRVETSGFFISPSKDCKVCGENTMFWVFVVIIGKLIFVLLLTAKINAMKIGDIVKSTVNPYGLLYGVVEIKNNIASVVMFDFSWLSVKYGRNPEIFEVDVKCLRVVQ